MSTESPELRVFALMGVCLMCVQQAERFLQTAIETVLDDPALKLIEQTESDRKQTFGEFLGKLRRRVKLEPNVRKKLYDFLQMRNQFVHGLSEIPGWDLKTEKGREAANLFLLKLTFGAIAITGLFTTVFHVWAKDNFNEEFFDEVEADQRQLVSTFEKLFGTDARKILAGKGQGRSLPLLKNRERRL